MGKNLDKLCYISYAKTNLFIHGYLKCLLLRTKKMVNLENLQKNVIFFKVIV